MAEERKLAVFFPGIGYHVDKPLLYYSRKIAVAQGFEILCMEYGDLPVNRDEKGMPIWEETYKTALEMTEKQLDEVDFSHFDKIVFVSKSIGTVVAAFLDKNRQIGADHVFYTPVAESFHAIGNRGIVFHGTADPLADTETVKAECEKRFLPLYITKNGNHSLETGDVVQDIWNMQKIMKVTEQYLKGL